MYLLVFFLLYQLIQFIILPFFLGYLFLRKFCKKKRTVFAQQRFGFVPSSPAGKRIIWLHAVSVGETLSLEYFIALIKKEIPDSICYLTVGTDAAKNIAQKSISADIISYLPYDYLPCMLLAYHRIKPSALIVAEAELWPNLLMLAHFKQIKLYSLNSRISKRSNKKIAILRLFFTSLINCFDTIFTQSLTDKEKFQNLGISEKKLVVLNNLKAYNVALKKDQIKKSLTPKSWNFPVLLAGSIHPGELNHYLELFKSLKPNYPDLKLILAPRHFTWKTELSQELISRNLQFFIWDEQHPLASKNELEEQLVHIFKHHDILVVCVLGELFKLYAYADIFFLGGTFVPVGGHNLLEPAVWGVPSIVGPMIWGCQEHADTLEKVKALFKAIDQEELLSKTQFLLAHHEQRLNMGNNALIWLNSESQQVEKVLDQFIEMLK